MVVIWVYLGLPWKLLRANISELPILGIQFLNADYLDPV